MSDQHQINSDQAVPEFDVAQNATRNLVQVYHMERRMTFYQVSQNELRAITLVNGIATVCFSLGTGCLAMWMDIHKDLMLAGAQLTEGAVVLRDLAKPVLVWGGILFWLAGAGLLLFRRNFISVVERESRPRR